MKGTPKFWQAARNELLAMIEGLGPFHCFFTLSSAEKRWHEVIVAILEKKAMSCKQKLHYGILNKTKDQLWSLNAAQPVGSLIFKLEF